MISKKQFDEQVADYITKNLEQVADYITKNLKIETYTSEDWGGTHIITKLLFKKKVISESFIKVLDYSLLKR